MLHAHGKPISDNDGNEISYKAPIRHLRRFGCYVSRRIPEPQQTDNKIRAWSKPACMMIGYVHNSTTLWRTWDPEFKTVKDQSEDVFGEERNSYSSCPQAQEEDMLDLKNKEPRVEYFEEDQLEAGDDTRGPGQPMANDITTSGAGDAARGRTDGTFTTSGTGDAIRGRTDGTFTASGTGDAIRGRTDETSSGTDGRVSSSGHTRGGSRHAETPMVLRTNRGRTDSERNEVLYKTSAMNARKSIGSGNRHTYKEKPYKPQSLQESQEA